MTAFLRGARAVLWIVTLIILIGIPTPPTGMARKGRWK